MGSPLQIFTAFSVWPKALKELYLVIPYLVSYQAKTAMHVSIAAPLKSRSEVITWWLPEPSLEIQESRLSFWYADKHLRCM